MATTTTTNLGLVKPDYNEAADVAVLNQNADKIDAACGKYQNAMAIVANGNTHGAITSGQYVYVSGHSTLAEGLYTASEAIAVNGTLSLSNLAAVSNGGLNALNSNFANPTKWVDWTEFTPADSEKWNTCAYTKIGKIVFLYISVKGLTANTNMTVAQLPSGYRPLTDVHFCGFGGNAYLNFAHIYVASDGLIRVCSADTYAQGFISYPAY